jgi:uncharacterized peroxidase-related enzyme
MADEICWIEPIAEDDATGDLRAAYDQVRREDGTVHNLYKAFSRFPEPLVSADRLYKDIMHSPTAPLPKWLAELVSVQVAALTGCDYALRHHGANLVALHEDPGRARDILEAVRRGDWSSASFDPQLRAILAFGRKLTLEPQAMSKADIARLRGVGLDDAAISQIVQVAASFAYWTRVINGLGIQVAGEKVGKYPEDGARR